MKTLALIMLIVLLVAVGWIFLIPPGEIYFIHAPIIGITGTISRGQIHFDSSPDHFATNGFEHIERYVARLVVPSERYRSLHIFTPDGNRGFGLSARGTEVEASFIVDTRSDLQREAAIRSFFDSQGIAPSSDYLAETTRVLLYPISGSTAEVTALTKRILQELCSVSPAEALDISYSLR